MSRTLPTRQDKQIRIAHKLYPQPDGKIRTRVVFEPAVSVKEVRVRDNGFSECKTDDPAFPAVLAQVEAEQKSFDRYLRQVMDGRFAWRNKVALATGGLSDEWYKASACYEDNVAICTRSYQDRMKDVHDRLEHASGAEKTALTIIERTLPEIYEARTGRQVPDWYDRQGEDLFVKLARQNPVRKPAM